MPLDPLATRLIELTQQGSVTGARLTQPMRKRLKRLFEWGVLTDEKAGGGRRVVVVKAEVLQEWIRQEYPSGLGGTPHALPARAEAVANFRDSKAGRRLECAPLFIRAFGEAALTRGAHTQPIAALTQAHGIVGVLLSFDDPWTFEGTLALVENLELFLHVETAVPGIDAALWAAGRLDTRVLNWIAGLPACKVIHVGDYDPVGIDEYLRVRAALPAGRACLHVPEDFERRLVAYGKVDLLQRSLAVWERVRRDPPEEITAVLEVMNRHGKALEQEGLLIPLAPKDASQGR